MTTKNLISIVSPNYNKGNYIGDMIQSVIQQSYYNWELLIIDDGSSDDSIEIINAYKESDSRIKVIHRERQPKGGSVCRNIGLDNARGDYVIFLDSDDLLAPFCLEQRMEQMKKYKSLDFGVFPIVTFFSTPGDSNKEWRPSNNSNHLYDFLSHNLPWHTSSPIWRKHILEEVGGFDEKYSRFQDVELHTKVLFKFPTYKVFDKANVDVFYRIASDRSNKVYNALTYNHFFVESTAFYLEQFSLRANQLSNEKKTKVLKSLTGTVFSTAKRILTAHYILRTLSEKEALQLFENLIKNKAIIANTKKWKLTLLQFYWQLFKLGAWKLQGFNFVFKQIIKL